jgi:hypothetical protein
MRIQTVSMMGMLLGLGLCLVGGEPIARAEAPKNPTLPISRALPPPAALAAQNCANVKADITTKLVSGIEVFNTQPYGQQSGCTAFVVDFMVDHASGIAGAGSSAQVVFAGRDSVRETSLSNESYAAQVSKAACATYQHNITVFKKLSGESTYSEIGGGELKPTWNEKGYGAGPVCMLAPGPGYKSIPTITPPANGVDTYRVAISVTGAPGQLIASATHPGQQH